MAEARSARDVECSARNRRVIRGLTCSLAAPGGHSGGRLPQVFDERQAIASSKWPKLPALFQPPRR